MAICVTLLSALLGLQGPATRTTQESSLPPMPSPPPVDPTPPAIGPRAPAWQPQPAPPQPVAVAPAPAPAPAAPAPENMSLEPSSPAGPQAGRLWRESQPLIRRDSRIGAHIAPTFKLTGFGRSPGLMLGADFAISVDGRFFFGAVGNALATPLAAQRSDGRTFNMRVQYAGVTLGVALMQIRFFSLSVGGMVGGGRACLNDERLDRCVNRAAMFVAEPDLGFSFALTRVLRLVLHGGYRFAVAQPWSGPNNRLLGGWTATLAIRLGKF